MVRPPRLCGRGAATLAACCSPGRAAAALALAALVSLADQYHFGGAGLVALRLALPLGLGDDGPRLVTPPAWQALLPPDGSAQRQAAALARECPSRLVPRDYARQPGPWGSDARAAVIGVGMPFNVNLTQAMTEALVANLRLQPVLVNDLGCGEVGSVLPRLRSRLAAQGVDEDTPLLVIYDAGLANNLKDTACGSRSPASVLADALFFMRGWHAGPSSALLLHPATYFRHNEDGLGGTSPLDVFIDGVCAFSRAWRPPSPLPGVAYPWNVEVAWDGVWAYPTITREVKVPPPRPPPALLHEYTEQFLMPAAGVWQWLAYRDEATASGVHGSAEAGKAAAAPAVIKWTQGRINYFIEQAAARKPQYYKALDPLLFKLLDRVAAPLLRGAAVAVVGSVTPWYEALALHSGAAGVVTWEYGAREVEDPRIRVFHPDFYVSTVRQPVDVAICLSSVEHTGLGRYGDPLDGRGDLVAMRRLRALVKPGGHLILAVPTGADALVFNLHRVYGRWRWALLTEGWRMVDAEGWSETVLSLPPNKHAQPVVLLRNEAPVTFAAVAAAEAAEAAGGWTWEAHGG